jgi:hypothetical protein
MPCGLHPTAVLMVVDCGGDSQISSLQCRFILYCRVDLVLPSVWSIRERQGSGGAIQVHFSAQTAFSPLHSLISVSSVAVQFSSAGYTTVGQILLGVASSVVVCCCVANLRDLLILFILVSPPSPSHQHSYWSPLEWL